MRARALLIVAFAGVWLSAFAYLFAHPPEVTSGRGDFVAFYCGASELSGGQDPYRYGPLYACEVRNYRALAAVRGFANVALPDPHPPYAIAMFTPLARLPYAQASFVWWFILLASALVIIWAITELTQLPLLLVAACVLFAVSFPSLTFNETDSGITVALLCAAALAATRSRWTAAAILLGLACFDPHVALGPVLAAFVLLPRIRVRLAVVAAVIAVTSLLAGGWALNAEYVRAVLPAHALSEIGFSWQYSLSALLYVLGMPAATALAVGSAQYALFVLLGIWLGARLRSLVAGSEILAPMALTVTGGTYVHPGTLWAAIPFALAVASSGRSVVAWAGAALVAAPWQFMVVAAMDLGLRPHDVLRAIPTVPADALADLSWEAYAKTLPLTQPWYTPHFLTYAGLALMYWGAFRALSTGRARREDPVLHRESSPRGDPV